MTADELQVQEIEQLWSRFKEQRAKEEDLQIADFAKQFPSLEVDILRVFPLMMELDDYAETSPDYPTMLQMPAEIGGYPIVRQIGVGGMGVVYEAQCDTLREQVAIKVISSERLDEKGIERFKQEARAVATLHHTNIVPIYAFGESEEHHYYTMRLIDGPNVAEVVRVAAAQNQTESNDSSECDLATLDLLEHLRNNWHQIAQLGSQAASALSHAHSKQILHRDVKPANLLIDSSLKLWITDFGLAKQTLDDNSLTSMYHAVGTPRYMAPEQLRGISDQRSDLFSLGLTLCELVTLQKIDSTTREALTAPNSRYLRRANPQVPAELERIILKSVALSPDDRYGSAAEMAKDLNAFAGKVEAKPAAAARRMLASTAAMLLAIGGLLLASTTDVGVSHGVQSIDAQPIVNRSEQIVLHVSEGSGVVGPLPESFGDLATTKLDGDDASCFQFDPVTRQLRFVQPPDFEVPLDRDMDNVYSVQFAEQPLLVSIIDVNEPPKFDEFVFESDHETIMLSQQQLESAWAIDVRDDHDRLYEGLCLTISGGADRDWVKMTTQGVFVFDRKLREATPVDADHDGIYEVEVTATDESPIWIARLEQQNDGKIALFRERVVAGAKLESNLLSEDCLIRRDVIDIATADGKTFYDLHKNAAGTVSLQRSTLSTRGTFQSTTLCNDCGIDEEVIGFATADGTEFRYLTRQHGVRQAIKMYRAVLSKDGSLVSDLISEDCRLPYSIEGFSWLDTSRFHHIRRQANGERFFYFSFQSGDRFDHMRLHNGQSQYTGLTRGQASWRESAPTACETVQKIRFQIVP